MGAEERKIVDEPIALSLRRLLEEGVQGGGKGVLAHWRVLVLEKVE